MVYNNYRMYKSSVDKIFNHIKFSTSYKNLTSASINNFLINFNNT